jgi:hypothetical protein
MAKIKANKKRSKTAELDAIVQHQSKGFCHFEGDVLVLNVLGTPSAKRDVIGKPKGDQLKISVTAAPTRGKATDHMVAFLAREFAVKTSQIEVVFGRMNINKQLRITAPQKLPAVIARFLNKTA